MLTSEDDQRRAAIRRTLIPQGTDGAKAGEVTRIAEVAFRTWRQVTGQLTPVIGVRGVNALFNRSLHLTSSEFPWLASAGDAGSGPAQLAGLKARLAAREAGVAAAASFALLVNFTELLASLIGGSLTDRLLDPVWAPPPEAPEKETHHA